MSRGMTDRQEGTTSEGKKPMSAAPAKQTALGIGILKPSGGYPNPGGGTVRTREVRIQTKGARYRSCLKARNSGKAVSSERMRRGVTGAILRSRAKTCERWLSVVNQHPRAAPPRKDPEAEGNQRQEGVGEPNKADTGWGDTLRGQVTAWEDSREGAIP